jgi:PAP2 superfamily
MKKLLLLLFILSVFTACKDDQPIVTPAPTSKLDNPEVALKWADMTLQVARFTPANTPTFGSRSFGYIGLTMYESMIKGTTTHQTIAPQLSGALLLPTVEAGKEYNWILSLNAGQSWIIKNLYGRILDSYRKKVDSLEATILTEYSTNTSKDIIDRSVLYGQDVAKAIFEWSKSDGGHEAYLKNGYPEYILPTIPGSWTKPTFSQAASPNPLHPYWGQNRTFVAANGQMPIPKPIPYSNDIISQYYAQFLEVYAKNKTLTDAEKETALWWSDDPSQTFTPPGHSYSLAAIAVKTAKPDLPKAAETFARVGMAVADAFINCWKCKYAYHVQRPASFVNANIDPQWRQFWPEPPFPAFSSGHATQGAAAATVLTNLYGEDFKFTDNSHEGRAPDPLTLVLFKNRNYNSFWEAAEESAYSRFLGGIHTRHDNETGLVEGRKIGRNINGLKWQK